VYIERLTMDRLRCFEEATIEFQHPDRPLTRDRICPNVNVLLGDNGVGKTTVLRAIALAALSPVIASSGFLPYLLVRQGARLGRARATILTSKEERAHSFPASLEMFTEIAGHGDDIEEVVEFGTVARPDVGRKLRTAFLKERDFLLVGYGATRRVESRDGFDPTARRKSRRPRYERVAGLFEDHIALPPFDTWLLKQDKRRAEEMIELLSRLLPHHTRLTRVRGNALFRHQGAEVPFGALSDGYRGYVGWVADLLRNMASSSPPETPLEMVTGIVLVDEVDLHLHPEWQRTVVRTLADTLPRLQFVVSTHSPLIVGSLERENILVVRELPPEDRRKEALGSSEIQHLDEGVHGKSSEQLLLSPYFGLTSTRAPDTLNQLRQLSVRAASGDRGATLEFLRRIASGESPNTSGSATPSKSRRKKPSRRRSRT
jgi:hypothetical protein